jgi:SAM-dependent methyltransferase
VPPSDVDSEVDAHGLVLRDAPHVPLLVHFDGQYVWSFTPGRDGRVDGGSFRIAWPGALTPYLSGTTRVRVATYDGAVVVHDDEVVFGGGEGRVALVDEQGAPLSIDKVGHLARAFEETPDSLKQEMLEATRTVIRVLQERCGVEAYLCYGALLGAVRQGTMLGHDSDVDLCYYSRHTSPADIIAESFRIQRELRSLGWRILRMSAADTKVLWELSDGTISHIDIFPAFTIDGTFYQFGNRNGSFDVDAHLLPLGTITLEGVEFPAPKHPQEMLAFVYGPHWRVPDPGFRYQDSPIGTRRLDGWFRGLRSEVSAWSGLFKGDAADRVPEGPSSFARWVEPQLGAGAAVVDVGAGTGRDALWLGAQGHRVLATDFSLPSMTRIKTRRDALGEDGVTAELFILNDTRRLLSLVVALSRDPHHLYARGLIGSLDAAARENLFRLAGAVLRGGQSLFLEFSAAVPGEDLPLPEPVGLTRRFDPQQLCREIEDRGGDVEFLEIGPGTDMFDQPDPAVARLRAVWRHP